MALALNNGTSSQPATLVSPLLQLGSSSCEMKFWYNSLGSFSQTLNVSLLIDNQSKAKLLRKQPSSLLKWVEQTIFIG